MHGDALTGTWLLRSHRMEDRETGETTEPFGAAPSGVLMIAADGRMAALITPGPGAAVAPPGVPAPLIAYSGHCRVPSPGRFVTTVDVASIASWVGTEQERAYTITGDRLELSTAPAAMPDVDRAMANKVGRMVWVRETSAVASGGPSD